ncbi:hypothetical protein V1520DRAFT_342032 [Lipomyces starkeyi]
MLPMLGPSPLYAAAMILYSASPAWILRSYFGPKGSQIFRLIFAILLFCEFCEFIARRQLQ